MSIAEGDRKVREEIERPEAHIEETNATSEPGDSQAKDQTTKGIDNDTSQTSEQSEETPPSREETTTRNAMDTTSNETKNGSNSLKSGTTIPSAVSSPAPRRPKPPTKGILKPPPPPSKPTLTNRLRDIVTVVGGGAKSLFDPLEEPQGAGPSTPQPPTVGGTLNAISGRLQMGLSRFVSPTTSLNTAPTLTPNASPLPRSVSLPDYADKERKEKQPLRRATFLLPSISITYPISSSGEPWSQKVLEDRKRVRLLAEIAYSSS